MSAPVLTRLIYLRLLCLAAAVVLVAVGFEGLSRARQAALRGELPVLQWGGER